MAGGHVSTSNPMEMNPHYAAFEFAVCADRFYAALLPYAQPGGDGEPTLAGQFLYAGELDEEGRALLVAANVLGAASLTVTADPSSQRRAIRDGVADFLVTTLDEALRILKNQLRKREPVAVCIAGKPQPISGSPSSTRSPSSASIPPRVPPSWPPADGCAFLRATSAASPRIAASCRATGLPPSRSSIACSPRLSKVRSAPRYGSP